MDYTPISAERSLTGIMATIALQQHTSGDVETEFEQNSLSDDVTKSLYKVPFFSLDGESGQPSYAETLKSVKDNLLETIKRSMYVRQFHAEQQGITLKDACETELQIITDLFKGLDKNLKTPILLVGLEHCNNPIAKGIVPNAFPAVFVSNEAIVSFNPKNLQKYYKYSLAQAKTCYQNVRDFIETYPSNKQIKLAIPEYLNERTFYQRNIYALPTIDKIHYMWSYGQDENMTIISEQSDSEQYLEILEKHDLPIPHLATWRSIAQNYFERNNKDFKWSELPEKHQKRFTVNTIRHNCVGYERAWRNATREVKTEFHQKAFFIVLRKIIHQFPYLRNECLRQMNLRENDCFYK